MNEEHAGESRGNGDWQGEAREQLNESREQAEQIAGEVDAWLRAFVQERPFVTIATAVAAGFVVGRLLAKK
jgi:ElaB/YqjD/DUF883 family membrane-anchored ribosome-binding protein